MEVGNETNTIRCKVQDSSNSFLTENNELRTEPIEIDQRRRRSSQKFGKDHDKVSKIIYIYSYNSNKISSINNKSVIIACLSYCSHQ